MKTKHFFNVVMVALIAVIFSALTTCATAGAVTGGAATAEAAAKKLAADLNAVKPDIAKVNGDTVRLTGRAEIETALTVPEGVTLDLTADGAALELQDGTVLTVNGAVNATGHGDHGKGWVEGSLRVGDGSGVIAGTGTVYLKSKGRLLNIGSDRGRRQLTLDGVTLVGLPDNDHSLVGIGENSELVLKSGAITGNTRSSDNWAGGGGVEVWHGTFTMEGGTIIGNSAQGKDGSSGGGVNIGEESVFTMTGGEISGNSAKGGQVVEGGGVRVSEGGTFIMSGGTITGNTATGGDLGLGGGVGVVEGGTFIMSGGTITGNTATGGNNTKSNGGGVVLNGEGTIFTMKGGVISANACTGGKNGLGGGVRVGYGSVFIMESGTIYGNVGSLPAGTDAILANKAQDGVSVYVDDATAKWGMGGTYQGGESQIGGNEIVRSSPERGRGTNDTLIAAPGQ